MKNKRGNEAGYLCAVVVYILKVRVLFNIFTFLKNVFLCDENVLSVEVYDDAAVNNLKDCIPPAFNNIWDW